MTIVGNGNWQLFLDDYVIQRSTGFQRVVHHPKDRGVVIPAEHAYEGLGVERAQVFRREDGRFEAHYVAKWWDPEADDAVEAAKQDFIAYTSMAGAYAHSDDGIHWEKPNIRRVKAPKSSSLKNLSPVPVPDNYGTENNLGSPFAFIRDMSLHGNVDDPQKRFVIRLFSEDKPVMNVQSVHAPTGYFAAEIPDFLNDPDWKSKLIPMDGTLNPRRHWLHFYDDIHDEWVAMEQGVVGHWLPCRDIARFSSKDLKHWVSDSVLNPDMDDSSLPHCYSEVHMLFPFFHEGIVFGLLDWMNSDRCFDYGGPSMGNPEAPFGWPGNAPICRKGTLETRIVISRDGGKTWDRSSSREAWIPHGTEEDSINRLVYSYGPPVRVGDEDYFYMTVGDGDFLSVKISDRFAAYSHERMRKTQIALYTQKRDRYVSLRTRHVAEVLVTKPLLVDGDRLQLNVDASRGEVQVGIGIYESTPMLENCETYAHYVQWSECKPQALRNLAEGFSISDCEPIHSNAIAHDVVFTDGADLSSLQGKTVRLFFRVTNADLYGFRLFKSGDR
ncbi:MAG: hypothetical protein HRT89_09380 [Lentisphaeria bacterium]|nr:hypothetical protein [Lentisphaeria bacterium]